MNLALCQHHIPAMMGELIAWPNSATNWFVQPHRVICTGSWSSGDATSCHTCSTGSTTAGPAATSPSDCNVCAPGWGGETQKDSDLMTVECRQCTPGFYSAGGTSDPCIACGLGFTSRARATDSSSCYAQWFSSDPYNWIMAPKSALFKADSTPALASLDGSFTISATEAAASVTNSNECQAVCGDHSGCQFWVYMSRQEDPTTNGCWLKLQAGNPAPNTYLSYKLWTGEYATWPADAGKYTAAH